MHEWNVPGTITTPSKFTAGSLAHTPLTLLGRQSDPLAQSFESAQWIWTTETDTPPLAPPGARSFRKTYTPPSGLSATSADILITADNFYTLYVGGILVGSVGTGDEAWKAAQRYHVSITGSGSILFAVEAVNAADPNTGEDTYAGLIVAVQMSHSDGSTVMFTSDTSWRASKTIVNNFYLPSFEDSSWQASVSFGAYGIAPWYTLVTIALDDTGTASVTASGSMSHPTSTHVSSLGSTSLPTSALTAATTNAIVAGITAVSSTPSSVQSSTSSSSVTGSRATIVTVYGSMGTSSLSDPSVTSSSSTLAGQDSGNSTTKSSALGPIIGGAVGGVVIFVILAFIVIWFYRDRRSRRSFPILNVEASERSSENFLVQPFILTAPNTNNFNPLQATSFDKSKAIQPHAEVNFHQDERDSEIDESLNGTILDTEVRLQRLRALMAELNQEIEHNGEGTPYVLSLRRRIAEIAIVNDEGGPRHVVPPPYHSSS